MHESTKQPSPTENSSKNYGMQNDCACDLVLPNTPTAHYLPAQSLVTLAACTTPAAISCLHNPCCHYLPAQPLLPLAASTIPAAISCQHNPCCH